MGFGIHLFWAKSYEIWVYVDLKIKTIKWEVHQFYLHQKFVKPTLWLQIKNCYFNNPTILMGSIYGAFIQHFSIWSLNVGRTNFWFILKSLRKVNFWFDSYLPICPNIWIILQELRGHPYTTWSDEGEGGFMKWPWMTTRGRGRVSEMTTWSGRLIFFVFDQKMAAWILHLSSTVYMPNFCYRYSFT